jgi:arylsulfatase A-like enzyme
LLRRKKVYEDTIIIISCDHGDSFGENGGHYMDHTIANEPVHRLPLVIKWPGTAKKEKCGSFVYQLDLAPTLCEMLNIPTPKGWDGESFAPALNGKKFPGRSSLVFDHGIYSCQRSVRTRNFMLTRTYHPGLYPIDEEYQLFDMKKDPHQQRNAAAKHPGAVKEHQKILNKWLDEQLPKHAPQPDPLEVYAHIGPFLYYQPDKMIARLKERGWKRQAGELVARLKRYGTGGNFRKR